MRTQRKDNGGERNNFPVRIFLIRESHLPHNRDAAEDNADEDGTDDERVAEASEYGDIVARGGVVRLRMVPVPLRSPEKVNRLTL